MMHHRALREDGTINTRKLVGNHRHLYGPVMWLDTRRRLRRVRVDIGPMGLIYTIRRTIAGRDYRISVGLSLIQLLRMRDRWRTYLAWEIRSARRKLRAEFHRSIERDYGVRIETPEQRWERERIASIAYAYGMPLLRNPRTMFSDLMS
jgi:hypothetical protein